MGKEASTNLLAPEIQIQLCGVLPGKKTILAVNPTRFATSILKGKFTAKHNERIRTIFATTPATE